MPTTPDEQDRHEDPRIQLMLEAARRATWNALHGPRYMRDGRFRPRKVDVAEPKEAGDRGDVRPSDGEADGESRRR